MLLLLAAAFQISKTRIVLPFQHSSPGLLVGYRRAFAAAARSVVEAETAMRIADFDQSALG